jgi:hypothetical protein
MLPLAAVEVAGAQAAGLEICVRSRRGRGRCGRAFRSAPCRRGRCGRRGGRGSRRDNPRLRLRVTSKARQVVVIAIVWHDTPPWVGAGMRGDMAARGCDVQPLADQKTYVRRATVAWMERSAIQDAAGPPRGLPRLSPRSIRPPRFHRILRDFPAGP